ncbi:putative glucuronoxylan 4-O-methyltransferase [Lupinus albus]|uniref:Putative glucuronoxylan 4-O-methyltransferase n=1 Tax=Lupinus albus TaxID=3870 RepID=A0A6A4P924_LUPAL|nr:putative glucuronoxylan 4-O-methyltransferase [Lupinus albus]
MQEWILKSSLFQPSQNRKDSKKKYFYNPYFTNPRVLFTLIATTIMIIALILFSHRALVDNSHLCSTTTTLPFTKNDAIIAKELDTTTSPLVAILHYATAQVIPQQSVGEIRRPFDTLQYLAPCNFLVFGIGQDSLMWDSFNPQGITLFLEDDSNLALTTLQRFPILRAHLVSYSTRVSEAEALLASYKKDCWKGATADSHILKGNTRCPLALSDLPDEVYDRDWDVIMIDAPKGYFAAAPGRMAVIYSVAVMARGRKRSGVTHVFLHDVDRKIEQDFAKEFLCMKYKVGGIRKLWHFVIPPVFNVSDTTSGFC